jgi:hypothetical protein
VIREARPILPWSFTVYLAEFEECKLAFDVVYPGERAAAMRHGEWVAGLCPHWPKFRSRWLATHPFEGREA